MRHCVYWFAALGILLCPALACAAGPDQVDLPAWSVVPFAVLLLCIAVLPLAAEHWWHSNLNRAIVSFSLATPVVLYLLSVQFSTGQDTLHPLLHELRSYVAFIVLGGALYVISGGIVVGGDLEAKPLNNTLILAVGAVLANFIGTTGASVLLIRPLLRINRGRTHTAHLPVFFIFVVGNLGGLLTPLGDPPLFLGFLNGVPFFWTLALWKEWLLVNLCVLAVFFVWDSLASAREAPSAAPVDGATRQPLHVRGLVNLPLLGGVLLGILLQKALPAPYGEVVGLALMVAAALLSLRLTPTALREANGFSWGPIVEVAVVFLGIFVTMVPALILLEVHGKDIGLTEPWQYFWITGVLSGSLDNAPTYVTLSTLAAGDKDLSLLVHNRVPGLDGPEVLAAISCGAVFMGALTYIGNAPNFMVKAIADQAGTRAPSFFGYLAYAAAVLVPVFVVVTLLFFPPWQ
jgi:Na+/H+ antiporter NhaD/arsenite permease-like protein